MGAPLTAVEITAMKPNTWLADASVRGAGGLVFYASRAGNLSGFFRYTTSEGKTDRLPLGAYDPKGRNGYGLKELRAKAGELSKLYLSGVRDLRQHFEDQERKAMEEEEARQKALEEEEAARQREALARERYTLRRLCESYTDHLEAQGKVQTAKDVRSIFRVNILTPAPDLADTPAKEVTKAVLATRIREIREAGKERAAGKTRAYLFAAYNLALRAEGDTEAPAALIPFQIENNPVAAIKAIPVRAGNRALSKEELRTFIGKLATGLADQALKLTLFAGGQRGEQLLRARVSDFDSDTGILRLWDGKGRRLEPREHRLPLGPVAKELCQALVKRAREEQPEEPDPPLFASGKVSLVLTTLSHRVAELSLEMGGAKFTFRDLRRSVETQMAGLGISVDLRAQLLSHGLGGIQAKHYDRHGYEEEKKVALERWERHLEGKEDATSNVVQIRRKKKV